MNPHDYAELYARKCAVRLAWLIASVIGLLASFAAIALFARAGNAPAAVGSSLALVASGKAFLMLVESARRWKLAELRERAWQIDYKARMMGETE